MRSVSISILFLCLLVSCGRSSDNTPSLAFEKIRAFQESEDVRFLSEAHDLFRQCEDGKNGEKMVPYRMVLYEIFADYDGARNYISKIEGSHRVEQFDPVALRTELELYESADNYELNQVDSLLHQLIKRYALLYKETNDDYWLQEMVGLYEACRGDSQDLKSEFIPDSFTHPESFDMNRFLQLVDQSELSFEETYQEVLRVRNELNGFPVDCMNPRLSQAILESIGEGKKVGSYHYPDSVLCAGVWFDFRGEADSLYVLNGPMPLYGDDSDNQFLGYIEGKNCLVSFAAMGKTNPQTINQILDTTALQTNQVQYKASVDAFTSHLSGMNVCAWLVSSFSFDEFGGLNLQNRRMRR